MVRSSIISRQFTKRPTSSVMALAVGVSRSRLFPTQSPPAPPSLRAEGPAVHRARRAAPAKDIAFRLTTRKSCPTHSGRRFVAAPYCRFHVARRRGYAHYPSVAYDEWRESIARPPPREEARATPLLPHRRDTLNRTA